MREQGCGLGCGLAVAAVVLGLWVWSYEGTWGDDGPPQERAVVRVDLACPTNCACSYRVCDDAGNVWDWGGRPLPQVGSRLSCQPRKNLWGHKKLELR